MKKLMQLMIATMLLVIGNSAIADDHIKTIVLDEYNGYFSASETLAGLKPGKYKFVVNNKAGKMVGFQLTEKGTDKLLTMFPLEPGQSKTEVVTISGKGFKYRCPINPTPWYEIDFKQ